MTVADGDTWFDGMVGITSADNAITKVGNNSTNVDCVPANSAVKLTLTDTTKVIASNADGKLGTYTPNATFEINISNTGVKAITLSKALVVTLAGGAANTTFGVAAVVWKDAAGNEVKSGDCFAANDKLTATVTISSPGFTTASTSDSTLKVESDAATKATIAAGRGADFGAWAAGSGNVSQTLTFKNATAVGKTETVTITAEATILDDATLTATFTPGTAT